MCKGVKNWVIYKYFVFINDSHNFYKTSSHCEQFYKQSIVCKIENVLHFLSAIQQYEILDYEIY